MKRLNKVLDEYRRKFDARFVGGFDRGGIYADIIQLIGAEQFTWTGLPDTMNSHYAERAINSGYAVAYIVPDGISRACKGFTITPAAFVGVPNQIGETDVVMTEGPDYALELDMTKDKAVIIKNNDYYYSEYPNLVWFAEMLARTDESEKALIIWSKMHPIAKASTGIESEKLKEVLKDIIENDGLFNVIDDNSKIIVNSPTSRDDNVLRLSDENAVEKMHFLSEFHYELIKRYCTLYNMPFRSNAKSAQSLESELHNTDIFSKIINENRLKCRKDAAEKINAMFGYNITVDISDILKDENKIIDSNIQEEINEANPEVNNETGNDDETAGMSGQQRSPDTPADSGDSETT